MYTFPTQYFQKVIVLSSYLQKYVFILWVTLRYILKFVFFRSKIHIQLS